MSTPVMGIETLRQRPSPRESYFLPITGTAEMPILVDQERKKDRRADTAFQLVGGVGKMGACVLF